MSARQREKTITAGALAFYSGRMVESGRKVAGNSTVDAMADTPLSRERVGRHVSLDAPGLSSGSFYRVFSDRRSRWAVVDWVALRVDMEAFLTGCTARERRVVELKLEGYAQTEKRTAKGEGGSPALVPAVRAPCARRRQA